MIHDATIDVLVPTNIDKMPRLACCIDKTWHDLCGVADGNRSAKLGVAWKKFPFEETRRQGRSSRKQAGLVFGVEPISCYVGVISVKPTLVISTGGRSGSGE